MSVSSFVTTSHSVRNTAAALSLPAPRRRDDAAGAPSILEGSSSAVHFPGRLGRPPHAVVLRRRPPRSVGVVPGATGALVQDAGATAAVLAGAYSLVFAFDTLTKRNLIQQSLSRKVVHVLSGLLFMVSWPIFSNTTAARYFASLVPLVNCLRLIINGFSLATDEGLVKSVTRDGNPKELLRGPLYYVLMLTLCAIIFWRESPTGVISLAMMCGGDGVADIIGRRLGSQKLPYNEKKSWAGSISMFLCGFLISVGMLRYFTFLGYFQLDWDHTLQRVALISLVATMVESLPTTQDFTLWMLQMLQVHKC